MPDPAELLDVGRLLSTTQPVTDAQMRRAVSSAYYALFHKVLRVAATRFMGLSGADRAGYTLLYRSFDHTHMKQMCKELNRKSLGEQMRRHLGRTAVSHGVRAFASSFGELQEARHRADYYPESGLDLASVAGHLEAAGFAMEALDNADDDERTDVLALLMVKPRG